MEGVLEVYHRPHDPLRPVVCLDERPKTLRDTPRGSRPARPGRPARQDYEYDRYGSCNVFLCVEPLVGKRQVSVTQRRALLDFADQLRLLSDGLYPEAEKIALVLDNLNTHTPAALYERFNVISLYTIVSQLLERYVVQDRGAEIARWFLDFETHRRAQAQLSEDEADPEMVVYHEKTSHSTDALDSIQWRHDFLMRKLFEAVPDMELKDDQRDFAREQRLAIFRRDGGLCQLRLRCDGARCEWDNWAADHIKPHSLGGKTTVANGQVACMACNSAKGNSVDR